MQESRDSEDAKPPVKPKLKIKAPTSGAIKSAPPRKKASGFRFGRFVITLIFAGMIVAGVMYWQGRLVLPDHPLLNQWLPGRNTSAFNTPSSAALPAVESTASPTVWRNEDFMEGVKLLNRALSDYKSLQASPNDHTLSAVIKETCLSAIERFDTALEDAPEDMKSKVRDYRAQVEGLLANLSADNPELAREAALPGDGSGPDDAADSPIDLGIKIEMKGEAPKQKRTIIYEDDEPDIEAAATQEESIAANARLPFDPGWNQAIPDAGGIADELRGLMQSKVTALREPVLEAGIPVYEGIDTLTPARSAARKLGQSLPIKRPLNTPGLPDNSLFCYTFDGDFARGANRVVLVVDAMDRVVMSQLRYDQPNQAVLSPTEKYQVFDFLNLQRRVEGGQLVGHRIKTSEKLVLVESELMDAGADAGGRYAALARIQWYIPRQMAGLILGSRP